MTSEMDQIIATAQSRMDNGEPPLRVVGAHFPLAQAGAGVMPWATEDELDRLHVLRRQVIRNDSASAAAARIAARIMHRKAQNLSMSAPMCTENGGK